MKRGRARGANSGRIAVPDELRRSETIRLQITVGDKADLEHIARGWGVPLSTAAYAMVATELASARGHSLSASIFTVEVMASVRLLAAQRAIRNQKNSFEG